MFATSSGIVNLPGLGPILTGPTDEIPNPARLPHPDEIDTLFYHRDRDRDCRDGSTSMWSAWKRLGSRARYIPFGYDDPLPDLRGRKVAFTDIHVQRPKAIQIHRDAEAVIFLDHHTTGEEWMGGLPNVLIDQSHSGAWLAWKFFHPDEEVPTLVRYVQDQDLWQWQLPNSRFYFSALELFPHTIDGLEEASKQDFAEMVTRGHTVTQHIAKIAEQVARTSLTINWHGHKTVVVNSAIFPGEIADLIAKSTGTPIVFVWYLNKDGKIKVSLRSHGANPVNVKNIAKQYPNGGGHDYAAGFTYPGANIGDILNQSPTEFFRLRLRSFLARFNPKN